MTLPAGLAFDAAGNLYTGEPYRNVIRRVSPAGIITTVVGDFNISPPAFSGDGGPATTAGLNFPNGLAFDTSGNLYISDQNNRRIRRVNVSGVISTVAGSGATNHYGDGGPATQAALDFPADVAVDGLGNLFIADAINHRVRKVTPSGLITTIAGTGTAGFSGDGGPAASAQLNRPVSVAVDTNGNVYISDLNNLRIRRVTPDGIISTYAGNGGYGPTEGSNPTATSLHNQGIAVDRAGNLYIADGANHRVRKVTAAGLISTVAGSGVAGSTGDGGPATAAMLYTPIDVTVDAVGVLYFTENFDGIHGAIRKVARDGTISTLVKNAAPGANNVEGVNAASVGEYLDGPDGIAADNQGNVYFDSGWHIYRVNPAGIITILVGAGPRGYQEGFDGDGGPSVAAHLVRDTSPIFGPVMGMATDDAGNLFFADTGNDRIRKITNTSTEAQLAITTPDGFGLYQLTGADQPDFFFYGNSSQRLNIINVGTGPMEWTATANLVDGCTFLQLSSSSGSAPSTITVSVNTANVTPGRYWCTFQISARGASNSPRYVSAVITVPIPNLNSGASSGTYIVKEQAGVGWFASSNANWLTITSQPSGQGAGSFSYSVAANPGSASRPATLTVPAPPI